ncbi:MAG TPA: hypothetical protein VKO20_00455 [Desulfosalsimonadaceae bacterium]|nr:hypothetical protein [Desulfosalsimonadaceae bacterium]
MKRLQQLNVFDRLMAAISFAEVNEAGTAVKIMEGEKQQRQRKRTQKAPEKQVEQRQRLHM